MTPAWATPPAAAPQTTCSSALGDGSVDDSDDEEDSDDDGMQSLESALVDSQPENDQWTLNNASLSREQEAALATFSGKTNPNPKAVDALVKSALLLVKIMARDYLGYDLGKNSSDCLQELVAAGNEGLFHAARLYNARFNVPFWAFARKGIRFTILRHIQRNKRLVRIGTARIEQVLMWAIFKEANKYFLRGVPIDYDEIAAEYGTKAEVVSTIYARMRKSGEQSFDANFDSDPEDGLSPLEARLYTSGALIDRGLTPEQSAIYGRRLRELRKALEEFRAGLTSPAEIALFDRRIMAEEDDVESFQTIGESIQMSKQTLSRYEPLLLARLQLHLSHFHIRWQYGGRRIVNRERFYVAFEKTLKDGNETLVYNNFIKPNVTKRLTEEQLSKATGFSENYLHRTLKSLWTRLRAAYATF